MNLTLLLTIFFPFLVNSYYKQGHSLIGELTDNLLNITTKKNIGLSIKKISPWADAIRKNSSYNWARPLHYIDTDDDAEHNQCSIISFKEHQMNIYTALTNYSTRLHNKEKRTDEDLKFFVHFYQDLYQPLHMSGIYRGGNSYKVNFFGRKANLHQVWDYLILRDHMQEKGKRKSYLKYLIQMSQSFPHYNPFDFKFWIKHNNKLNCEYIYKNLTFNITKDYYNNNKYIIDHLIVINAVNLKNILETLY